MVRVQESLRRIDKAVTKAWVRTTLLKTFVIRQKFHQKPQVPNAQPLRQDEFTAGRLCNRKSGAKRVMRGFKSSVVFIWCPGGNVTAKDSRPTTVYSGRMITGGRRPEWVWIRRVMGLRHVRSSGGQLDNFWAENTIRVELLCCKWK